jgi:hypothetical protein
MCLLGHSRRRTGDIQAKKEQTNMKMQAKRRVEDNVDEERWKDAKTRNPRNAG